MRLLLLLTTVAAVAFTGLAVGKDAETVATLCAKKKGGALRLDADGKCKSTESRLRVNQRGLKGVAGANGAPGTPGPAGPPGADATPADFAGGPTITVGTAPAGGGQCSAAGQFCTGGNLWRWRNYGNGYQPVGFWKDRGGVVHLEGMAELYNGSGGAQPPAFVLPEGYRPAATRQFALRTTSDTLRYVDVRATGEVDPVLGGGGTAPLDGISFRP